MDTVYKEFYPGGTISIEPAKGVNPPDWGTERSSETAFVATIENGSIWRNGPWHFVLTPDKKLLSDLSYPFYWHQMKYDPSQVGPITHYARTAAFLAGSPVHNYYHWLIDFLPRIHLLQMSGFPFDYYVMPKLHKAFHWETLSRLGVPKEKIIEIESDPFHLKAERLVVASMPNHLNPCPKWCCDFVRNSLLIPGKQKNPAYKRIYISREDAMWRKVINEDQVMTALSTKGFKKVTLGSLSVEEQIDMFASAECIISAHGAQLSNIVFCTPGTNIIELYAATTDCFWQMSSHNQT